MDLNPFSSIIELGQSVIERIWPDANTRAIEMRKLKELEQKGDLAELQAHVQRMVGQLGVNKVEASHPSIFVAGWRPFIGWVGGLSLAYAGILHPLLAWLWTALQAMGYITAGVTAPPLIASGILGTIVTGMLGIGTMRSYDKTKGIDSKGVK